MIITDKDLQKIIGGVLKYGVITVLVVATIGGLVYLFHHSNDTLDYSKFVENDRSIFEVISTTVKDAFQLKGRSIIYLGILILFFTPFLRLILSLFSFVIEKDKLYIAITLIVIGVVAMSVFFGFSH
ncbi:bacteriocin-type signal sequence-containing protein [Chishuiella changwenlii]|mgnify:FL=1|uniref:Bacteriocin-type signal sequence-containing protein n=1 Tax=Chishuiella changwenlii TaxID=1434701 RepID=A0A1M6TYZ9_9FLAO|nr:DUF1634 domain-containing protein [Chishuiella changwenlii]GGF08417.1 hypothetical protein GCM10010984_26970 [Chishuiella changwenlii]SHK62113.1 bacteriocin-type signal sequence-containing protein [Chishuiella changwenlii]